MRSLKASMLPLKVWLYDSVYMPLMHGYERRWTQYTRTGKVALCCIAKMENKYIRFFVEYYKNLQFDKIFIYDNNDPDGERIDEVIGDYIESNFVEVIDFRGRKVAQLAAYQDCYERYNGQYSWIAFFDCDEFLTFADTSKNIHTFLRQLKFWPFQLIHINWKVFGDNGLLDDDGGNVVDRFPEPVSPYDFKAGISCVPENNHIKSILRGGLPSFCWNETPHTPSSGHYHCCNPVGSSVDANSPFQDYDFSIAFIRHYSTKTIGEWVRNKMKRGIPDRSTESWKEVLNLETFFKYNQRTEEKQLYAEEILKNELG